MMRSFAGAQDDKERDAQDDKDYQLPSFSSRDSVPAGSLLHNTPSVWSSSISAEGEA